MTDVVHAETAAVQTLHRGVTAYAESLRTAVSALRHEAHLIAQATHDVVDRRRANLQKAEAAARAAEEALRHCTEDRRHACEESLRIAHGQVASSRQSFDDARRAEMHVTAALHGLMQTVGFVESVVGDQASSARAALVDLEDKLRAITTSRDLTDADRAALRDVTGLGYRQLNRSLSQGSLDDVAAVAGRVNAVTRAVEKLPVHEGTVLRGSSGNLTDAQIGEYVPGEIRVEDRFLHSSVDPDVADGRFHGNVVWVIESTRGRRVESHSEVPSEREVVFDKFSRFEVLAKNKIDTGQWLIYMREL